MQYTNYKQLDIYQSAMELFLTIHPLSLKLPKFEMYELGGQIRGLPMGLFRILWRDMEGENTKQNLCDF